MERRNPEQGVPHPPTEHVLFFGSSNIYWLLSNTITAFYAMSVISRSLFFWASTLTGARSGIQTCTLMEWRSLFSSLDCIPVAPFQSTNSRPCCAATSQKIVGHSNPSTLLLVAGTFVAKQVSNRKSIDLIVTSACIHWVWFVSVLPLQLAQKQQMKQQPKAAKIMKGAGQKRYWLFFCCYNCHESLTGYNIAVLSVGLGAAKISDVDSHVAC